MRIAKYWAQVEHTLIDKAGKPLTVRLYGWSDRSQSDAEACARARGAKVSKLPSGGVSNAWYLYDDRPLREMVLEEHSTKESRVVITRSRVGTKVLNTDKVGFIDIDVYHDNHPTLGSAKRHGFFAKLFGKKDPMLEKEEQLRKWFSEHSRIGMRLYRTPNGFRGIFTHALLEPAAGDTQSLLSELGADPLYIRLCKGQECFRARLTAKPWRINGRMLSSAYPYTMFTDERQREECRANDEKMARLIDREAEDYAACRFVEQLGSSWVASEPGRVAELHDRLSGALTDKALA